ncbi:DUF417 family protein [Gelidibacter japonicus]|uniref:DUF417 family protein n=1 Tax=Gelidibacter japonicus TaxID=1962232 RepID=UPI003A8DFAAE
MKTAAAMLSIVSLTSVIRYGLVLILIGIGLLKFTKHEAEAIRPLAENSPFFSWAFALLSTRMFSSLTGGIEITMGILIALRQQSPTLSSFGSIGAIITFLIILTFMVSSPMHINKGLTIPFIPNSPWQFFIIHLILLGASVWTAYEAFASNRIS